VRGEVQRYLLALSGGPKAVVNDDEDIFRWPIITDEHRNAVLGVLNDGNMSGTDITDKFEKAYANDIGMKYALGCNNGTAAIQSGFYGIGIGVGHEVIVPSLTYWASLVQLYSLGATPVFADVVPDTLCIDPDDIEKKISDRTKAIVVVHYAGMVADMDRILVIAKKHNLKVFEDCSHAHACTYKGKEVGTFGDASGFSLMSGKSFAIGEAGIMFTNDQEVYERAVLFGHYCKHDRIQLDEYKEFTGPPCGGYKFRMHQLSSAFGLVQLKYYRRQFEEIDRAMSYFCDLVGSIPGLKPMIPDKANGHSKGGWYFPLCHYAPEAFGGLSNIKFAEALNAEGTKCGNGCNIPLHTHPLFTSMDVYGHGRPTRFANMPLDIDKSSFFAELPVTDKVNQKVIALPWFKKYEPDVIKQHAQAFIKVAGHYRELLPLDEKKISIGSYAATKRKSAPIVLSIVPK
jgi:dTDP-4-amino-4,6-dideoxygalactose transaminase